MAVAFTAFAFDSSFENGGHGVKIVLYRVQAARVAQRDVRESRLVDASGSRRYDGNIIRMSGDAYLIDCNVTVRMNGHPIIRSFHFCHSFVTKYSQRLLVTPGGTYNGYLPVLQGGNAGPHVDGTFHTFVKALRIKGMEVGASGTTDTTYQ